MVKAVVIQLEDGQGLLVRVDIYTGEVEVDYRREEVHSWEPIPKAKSFGETGTRYRVEDQ